VLADLAAEIHAAIRSEDVFARYGGEEFAVVCRATDVAGAAVFGERLRAAIEARSLEHEDQPMSVTVSVGIAGLSPSTPIRWRCSRRRRRALRRQARRPQPRPRSGHAGLIQPPPGDAVVGLEAEGLLEERVGAGGVAPPFGDPGERHQRVAAVRLELDGAIDLALGGVEVAAADGEDAEEQVRRRQVLAPGVVDQRVRGGLGARVAQVGQRDGGGVAHRQVPVGRVGGDEIGAGVRLAEGLDGAQTQDRLGVGGEGRQPGGVARESLRQEQRRDAAQCRGLGGVGDDFDQRGLAAGGGLLVDGIGEAQAAALAGRRAGPRAAAARRR
jgi:hypothetical protein